MKTYLLIGAGPGIGLATATRFAQQGFHVVLAARNVQRLQRFADALQASGYSASIASVDASDPLAVAALVQRFASSLQVVHYNVGVLHYDAAGALQARPLEAESVTSLAADMQLNVTGALAAIHSAVPVLATHGAGTVLLTGGGLGVQPSGSFLTLSVGKAALRAAALALFEPLKQQGVHIATVTVSRLVSPDSPQPAQIADAFWALHDQPPGQWTVEAVYA